MRNLAIGSRAVMLAALTGCGSDSEPEPAKGEQGPACAASELGRVTEPSPLISVGKRVVASDGALNPEAAVDGRYHGPASARFPAPSEDEPGWISIEVGSGPERLLLVWTDPGWTAYDVLTAAPTAYRIETSGDSSDGVDGSWESVSTTADNRVRSRGHTFPFAGKSWVRFVVTAASEGATGANVDEIAIHDVTASGSERPSDTWFFMGDSITQGGMQREFGVDAVDARVHEMVSDYYPAVINGGIGGELASDGVGHLEEWLELNPDFSHFMILYGTNDSWGNKDPVAVRFQERLETLVDELLLAGRVPILATIPHSTTAHDTLPDFNAVIETVVADKGLPCGPDFYGWFLENPDDLSSDGVHPNTQGYRSMNLVWAETLRAFYPSGD